MGKEIASENGRISDFQRLVTLTLTLDRVILHTVMHQSSTSTYIPNFIKIEETFYGRTNVQTDVQMNGQTFETYCIRSTRRSPPKNLDLMTCMLHGWLVTYCQVDTSVYGDQKTILPTFNVSDRQSGSIAATTDAGQDYMTVVFPPSFNVCLKTCPFHQNVSALLVNT